MASVKDLLVNGSSRFIGKIYASDQFISQVANGTAPFVVSSSTLVTNLNSDLLDGYHASDFFRYEGWWNSGNGWNVDNALGMAFTYADHGAPNNWGTTVTFEYTRNSPYRFQMHSTGYNNALYYRNKSADRGGWTNWARILDSENSYVSSGYGYINGTQITALPGFTRTTRVAKDESNNEIESVTGWETNNKSFIQTWGFAPTATYRTTEDRPAPYGIGFTDGSDSGGIMPVGNSNYLAEIRFYGANSGPTYFTFGRQIWEDTGYDNRYSNKYETYAWINSTTGRINTNNSFTFKGYEPIIYSSENTIAGYAGEVYFGGNFHIDSIRGYALYLNYYYANDVSIAQGGGKVGVGQLGGTYKFNVIGTSYSSQTIYSGVSSSTDLTHIPSDSEVALTTGNGNGAVSAWIWRENYASSNWGIFHNNSTDYIHFVGGNTARLSIDLGGGNVGIGNSSPSYKLDVSGDTRILGNLYLGANASNNFIAFYGNTGDDPGYYQTSFIGEHLWGGSESTELLLMKFNDGGNGTDSTTASGAGPDRIRHLAHGHVFQIMTDTSQGDFVTMANSSSVETKFDIARYQLHAYAPLAIISDSTNSGYDGLVYMRHYSNNDWGLIVDKSQSYTYGVDIRAGGEYALKVGNGNTRLIGATIIGADATPSYTLDVRGTATISDITTMAGAIKVIPSVWSELFTYYGLASDYTSRYDTEEFLKAWVKYAYEKGAGYTVMSYISPNSRGFIEADVYASGINSTTGFPEHITGRYYPHSGSEIIFGTSYGTWYYRTGIDSGNISSQSVNYAANADTVDNYHASNLWRSDGGVWNPSANITLGATANGQEWSFDISRNGYTGCYWHVWDSSRSIMLQVTPDDGKVRAPYGFVGNLEGTANYATRAAYLDGHGVNPDNSHPGYGARVFYSWNTGQAGNSSSGYSNGITIGSHPSDTAYGFQIVQNMWDDNTYTRRYNGGWQDWKTLLNNTNYPNYIDGRYLRYEGWWSDGSGQNVDDSHGMNFTYTGHGAPHHWGTTVTFECERGSAYRLQLHGTGDNYLYFRNRSADYGGWHSSGWKQILTNQDTYVASDGTNRGIINGVEVQSARHLLINGVTWNSDWHWSGQSGQPTWLWGSNDGTNMYVWNPSNFSVNYANSAGQLSTTRYIYGNAFNGTQNVSGNLTLSTGDQINFQDPNNDGVAFNYNNNKSSASSIRIYNGRMSEIARFTTSGYFGIGTSSPSYRLHVIDDTYTSGYSRANSGFIKSGSSDSYVLLGGGGHKAESSLSVSNSDKLDGYHYNNLPYHPLGGSWKPSSLSSYTRHWGWAYSSAEAGLASNGSEMQIYTDGKFWQREGAYYCLDNGNTYVTSSGNGVINGTTITQISNADTVDGYHYNNLPYASWKEQWIDMTGYSDSYWHPVVTSLPYAGYRRIKVTVQLNSGTAPSWSTHPSGFTCNLDLWTTAHGWGTTNSPTICLNSTYGFADQNPVGWFQLGNASHGILLLRGGGKYLVCTDWDSSWTIYNQSTTDYGGTQYEQTCGPYTSWPGIFNGSTTKNWIYAHLQGNIITDDWLSIRDYVGSYHGRSNNISGYAGEIWFGGNFHIDSQNGQSLYLNYYTSASISLAQGGGTVGIGQLGGNHKLNVAGNIDSYNFKMYGNEYPVSCNNVTNTGLYYYTGDGPSGIGNTTGDGALYSQAYSTSWVGQIAQDYRNGNLFVRGKNSGTWTSWRIIPSILTNAVNTVASLDCNTYTMYHCTLTVSSTMSLSDTPRLGRECHIIIFNASSSAITVTLPSSYRRNVSSITIAGYAFGEVNILNASDIIYVRAV